MKKNTLQELLKAGRLAILKEIETKQMTVADHRLKSARGETKNLRASRDLRRDIAVLKTVLPLAKVIKVAKETK